MPHWQKAAVPFKLQAGELHIWKIELNHEDSQWQPLMSLLSNDEQIKADRFRFAMHRRRYVFGRTSLRKLLGGYLDRTPETLRFAYNSHGKPFLANDDSGLSFNVAHSEDLMLAAFVLNKEIGIDIETIQPQIDYMGIAQRLFSEQENNTLQHLPEEKRIGAFFRAWTRKEAYIKAQGTGLSYPLNCFSVSMDETSISALDGQDGSQENKSWQIHNIEVSNFHSAAIAIEAAMWDIQHYHLTSL